jgi:hypothetical protein
VAERLQGLDDVDVGDRTEQTPIDARLLRDLNGQAFDLGGLLRACAAWRLRPSSSTRLASSSLRFGRRAFGLALRTVIARKTLADLTTSPSSPTFCSFSRRILHGLMLRSVQVGEAAALKRALDRRAELTLVARLVPVRRRHDLAVFLTKSFRISTSL